MKALFYQIQHSSNLGMIIRSAVGLNVQTIYLTDPKELLTKKIIQIRKVSQGTIEKIQLEKIEDIQEFLNTYKGRKIATVCNDPTAIPLERLTCYENDLLVFGNERGLPEEIINHCDLRVNIPLQINSLNIACAFSIFAYKYSH